MNSLGGIFNSNNTNSAPVNRAQVQNDEKMDAETQFVKMCSKHVREYIGLTKATIMSDKI